MIRRALKITLCVRSPFLFEGLGNALFGVDAAALRNEAGAPIIPAEQVKGVLRAACSVFCGYDKIDAHDGEPAKADVPGRAPGVLSRKERDELFGGESPEANGGEQNVPKRGNLTFADLTAARHAREGIVTRIEIDDDAGAVKQGALQVIELAAPLGAVVKFTGEAVLFVADTTEADRLTEVLDKALRLVPAIGSAKSAGFGEVVHDVAQGAATGIKSDPDFVLALSTHNVAGAKRRAYAMTFDRPFLVEATRIAGNMFVGAEVVPGAAIKGALATALLRAGAETEAPGSAWEKAFAALRISHAFPENDDGVLSGFRTPQSVIARKDAKKLHFADALATLPGEACLLDDRTPAFPVDWKPEWFETFSKDGHSPKSAGVGYVPRIHVAIDRDSLIAIDQKLFGTIRRSALVEAGDRKRRWRLIVDAECLDDAKASQIFDLIGKGIDGVMKGLDGVGRSGATAEFEEITIASVNPWSRLREAALPTPAPYVATGAHSVCHALTLLTPALLVEMGAVAARPDRRITFDDYERFWRAATGGELLNAFATATLAGGYVATRRRVFGAAYYPFTLTDAGSVFLVRGADPAKLAQLLRWGLEPPAQTGGEPLTWRTCPYVPQNGYGEIACNLVDHAALRDGVTDV